MSIFDFFAGLSTYNQKEQRKGAMTAYIDDITIDTCYTFDVGKWETAIKHLKQNGGNWMTVERYETEEQAKSGHLNWIQQVKDHPERNYEATHKEFVLKWGGLS